MRSLVLLSLCSSAAIILQGCHAGRPAQDTHTIAPTSADGVIEGRPTLGRTQSIPGQRTVLVPFAVETQKGLFERDDPYDRARASYDHSSRVMSSVGPRGLGWGGDVRWHNAIIRDLDTGQEWPILDRRGIIGEWHIMAHQPEEDGPWISRAVVFIAVLDDTNKDGMLDNRDARIAIVTDADGRNPRIVTPRDGHVWSTAFNNEVSAIFFQVATDINGDGTVDFNDSAVPYFIKLGDLGPAKRLVSEGVLTQIERLLADPTPVLVGPPVTTSGR